MDKEGIPEFACENLSVVTGDFPAKMAGSAETFDDVIMLFFFSGCCYTHDTVCPWICQSGDNRDITDW